MRKKKKKKTENDVRARETGNKKVFVTNNCTLPPALTLSDIYNIDQYFSLQNIRIATIKQSLCEMICSN